VAEVAAALVPRVVLFGENRADQADQSVAVGKDPEHVGAAASLPIQTLPGIVCLDLARQRGDRDHVSARGVQVLADLRKLVGQGVGDAVELAWTEPDGAARTLLPNAELRHDRSEESTGAMGPTEPQ
jgi:hypothetical protein